jgi:ribulose-5-phosphate 4-epimerase/fuculose-1-phosphate aldolase
MVGNIFSVEKDLVLASRILLSELRDIWGHVTVRHPDHNSFLLKYIRPSLDGGDGILHVSYEGEKLSGPRDPPGELPIYTSIYAARRDINAIIHCHPETVIALSLVNKKVIPADLQSFKFKRPVPLYPEPVMICTEEEGNALAKCLGDSNAVVIKGHGVVTVSNSLQEACMLALQLEKSARIQALASRLGRVRQAPRKYVDLQLERMVPKAGKGETSGKGLSEWRYYCSLISAT